MKIDILNKIKIRIRSEIIKMTKKSFIYPFLYKSFWHYLLIVKYTKHSKDNYLTAFPNQGAGIGHQLANWISGYWFAQQFKLNFAHTPFSSPKWEYFLGFGSDELKAKKLLNNNRYKKVRLPLFDENKINDINLVRKIINSYGGKNVVFVCEQDQYYKDQFGVVNEIQQKFYNAPSRKQDKLLYDANDYNIAIHIRRGDIVAGQNKIANHTMRWLTDDYFLKALQNTLDYITTDKKINIYLFSQGKEIDFIDFDEFPNLNYCLDMGAIDSFLHMVMADALITSKSSFSYKPALLNKGLKVVPANFWHNYPTTSDWVLVDDKGEFIDDVKF